MTSSNRTPLTILGIEVGTHNGWDEHGSFALIVYDFQPSSLWKNKIPAGDLVIDYDKGVLHLHDDIEGRVTTSMKILEVLK